MLGSEIYLLVFRGYSGIKNINGGIRVESELDWIYAGQKMSPMYVEHNSSPVKFHF